MTFKELYFSFDGRVSRRTFWLQGVLPIYTSVVVVALLLRGKDDAGGALLAYFLVAMIAMVSIEVKRWHDLNKSGAWFFISFVPFIGNLWKLIECGCVKGTEGPNNYGDDPLDDDDYLDLD